MIPTAMSKYFAGGAIKPNAFRFEFCRLHDWQVTGRFAPQHVEIFPLILRAYFWPPGRNFGAPLAQINLPIWHILPSTFGRCSAALFPRSSFFRSTGHVGVGSETEAFQSALRCQHIRLAIRFRIIRFR